MNEIGEIGIDGKVVTGLANVEKMVELSSGCICCSIDEYRFDLAIQEIVDTAKPHLIIIESTGLADPEPLAYRVKSAGLGLDAVITVVDAANVDRQLAETEVARLQIEAADFLIVNKTDLVDDAGRARAAKRLGKLNARAERFETVRGAIESDLLFATGVARYRELARTSGDHLHADGIGSFLYRSPRPLVQEKFERLLAKLPRDVLRAKGIVRFAGRDWHCLFNFTCGRHEITWVRLEEPTEIATDRRSKPRSPPARPTTRGAPSMSERRRDQFEPIPAPPPPPPSDAGYTEEEEEEVRKRLEDLGYVE
jgi:G3E family GTPase